MAVRPILTADRPLLRQRAKPVGRVDAPIRKLMKDMVDTMRDAPGSGLAGPQIGVLLRVIVIEYEEELLTLANPEITWASSEMDVAFEGCLSIPGFVGAVERHTKVRVRAKDQSGKPVTLTAENWLARIFQHEIDHLDGILYTDRMAPGERLRPASEDDDDSLEAAPALARSGS